MESKSRLKQRLARLFHASTLLRTPCNYSTTTTSGSIFSSSAAGSASSRRSTFTDIVVDPVFLRRNGGTASAIADPPFLTGKVDRSLSLPLSGLHGRLDCGGGCRPTRTSSERDLARNIHKKKDRRARETRGPTEGNACPPASPTSPKKNQSYYNNHCFEDKNKGKEKKKSRKKLLSNGYGFSSSSSDEEFEFFSSDDEQGADSTFFSSRSFSSDSSGFYQRPSNSNANNSKKKKKKNKNKESEHDNNKKFSGRPPRHSRIRPNELGFQPVVSMRKAEEEEEEEETKRGFPVTKRSKDPYVDFRDSMVEMIVERQIFGAKDLEQLLRSYLSLNSHRHHPVILGAFADISEVLFGH